MIEIKFRAWDNENKKNVRELKYPKTILVSSKYQKKIEKSSGIRIRRVKWKKI